eukprot:12977625-Alexandrium_andersonii.AAC.1
MAGGQAGGSVWGARARGRINACACGCTCTGGQGHAWSSRAHGSMGVRREGAWGCAGRARGGADMCGARAG